MKLDIICHKGSDGMPAAVFIHGLGMNKDIWANPSSSRILGGIFPLITLLGRRAEQVGGIQTLFDDLRLRGLTVITWSQRRPAGPIDSVVPELEEIVKIAGGMTRSGIILIGHSRGGLIGRKYLLRKDGSVRGFITISTPHKGSTVAQVAGYLSPLVSILNPFFPEGDKGTLAFSVKRILEFLKSKALKELLPESNFFKSLTDGPNYGIYYASAGGTNPTLFSYRHFSFPDVFEKVIPENIYPEEMKKGKGDGLVTAASSQLQWSEEHHNFACNHAEILFDEDARAMLVKVIDRISFA